MICSHNSNIIYCSSCCKQVINNREISRNDCLVTTSVGAKAGVGSEVFCGFCAEELDENGLFPEERRLLEFL